MARPIKSTKYIVKDVRRQRVREDEERVWTSFLKQQESVTKGCNFKSRDIETKLKSMLPLAKSFEEVDRELLRLEEDALPERNCRVYKSAATEQEYNYQVQYQYLMLNM